MTEAEGSHDTMDELWDAARVRFKQRTGKSLELVQAKSLEDCLLVLEQQQASAKAMGIGLRILQSLKLLGGIAAQGASMIFPPATLCFNAVSLLLDVPQKVWAFRESIEGLFEAIAPSLSEFRIYRDTKQYRKTEPELRIAVHRLMIGFVDICALSLEYADQRRWRKLKVTMKAVLLNDETVKAEIEKFEKLAATHHAVQATQTLKVVLESNDGIQELLEKAGESGEQIGYISQTVASLKDVDGQRLVDNVRRRNLENIEKKLRLGHQSDQIRPPMRLSKELSERRFREAAPGTGNWLEDSEIGPDYRHWEDVSNKSTGSALCILTGEPGTGKSVLASMIEHRLHDKQGSAETQPPGPLIASYFFPRLSNEKRRDTDSARTALKCMAFQLAEQDDAYANFVSQVCSRTDSGFFRDASCRTLWDTLGLGTPRAKFHYLIFDGLPESTDAKSEAGDLISLLCEQAWSQSSVRILLSLTSTNVLRRIDASWYLHINICRYNVVDIKKHVARELGKKNLFQGQDSEMKRIRHKIEDRLSQSVGGSYSKANTALEQLERAEAADGEEEDIDRILEESQRDFHHLSKTVIDMLQNRLNAREISEVNELLRWTVYGKERFTPDQLAGALSLRVGAQSRIVPLRKKLEGKYRELFTMVNGQDVDVTGPLAELLKRPRQQPHAVNNGTKFSATITIQNADVTTVQSFLWSLSHQINQRDFGFQIDESKAVKGIIHVNKTDALLGMMRAAFTAIEKEPDKRTEDIVRYALQHLPVHLKEINEEAELNTQEVQEVGQGLIGLFSTSDLLERHWSPRLARALAESWGREGVVSVRTWLTDVIAADKLNRLERRWIKEIQDSDSPEYHLLKPLAVMVARDWLQSEGSDVFGCWLWLRFVLRMRASPREDVVDPTESTAGNRTQDGHDKDVTIEDTVKWCRENLQISSAHLMEKRVGMTYRALGNYEKAIESYEKAIDLGASKLECGDLLARTLEAMGKAARAKSAMNKVLDLLDSETSVKLEQHKDAYIRLSRWYLNNNETAKALHCAKKATSLEPEDHEAVFCSLVVYLTLGLDHDALALLRSLQESPVRQGGESMTERVIAKMSDRDFIQFFSLLSSDTAAFDYFLGVVNGLIARKRSEGRRRDASFLTWAKGAALYYLGPQTPADRARGLKCWQDCLEDPNDLIFEAAELLHAYCLEQARAQMTLGTMDPQGITTMASKVSAGIFIADHYRTVYNVINEKPQSARAMKHDTIRTVLLMIGLNEECCRYLADALQCCGEYEDALTAYSMMLPPSDMVTLARLIDFDVGVGKAISPEHLARLGEPACCADLVSEIKSILTMVNQTIEAAELPTNNVVCDQGGAIPGSYKDLQAKLPLWAGLPTYKPEIVFCINCYRQWDFDSGWHKCLYCPYGMFCDECLSKLKEGKLRPRCIQTLICKPDHKWLHLPPHNSRSLVEALSGRVIAGGRIEEGVRVGGETKTVREWIEGIQEKWGLPLDKFEVTPSSMKPFVRLRERSKA